MWLNNTHRKHCGVYTAKMVVRTRLSVTLYVQCRPLVFCWTFLSYFKCTETGYGWLLSHSCIDRGRLYDVCTSCPSLRTRLRHRHPEKTWSFPYELGLFCHDPNDADFMLPGAYTPLDFWDTLFCVFHNQATKPGSTCLHSVWSPFLLIWERYTLSCNTAQ